MSSLQSLREFISERLAAAAEEIFRLCEGTIVQYEQELCRQRRLLDICWKPQLQLHDIAFSQHDASEKGDFYNQQGISCIQQDKLGFPLIEEQQSEPELQHIKEEQQELEHTQIKEEQGQQEPRPIKEEHKEQKSPQMKEDQEGLCIIQVEKQLGALTYEENEYSEEDLNNQMSFNVTDCQGEEENQHEESTSTSVGETDPQNTHQRKGSIFYKMTGEGTRIAHNESVNTRTKSDDRPYICEQCSKTFSYLSRFRIHMRTHTGEKPFSCKVCDKSFPENCHLLRHLRTHTGEKPFSCKECNTSFNQKSSLARHMRTHTGEKPFSCKYCDRSFCDKYILKRHIRTHTGERPFSCNGCNKSFSHISNLKVHMRTHTGERPFSCKECNTSFREMSFLKRHMMTHMRETPFACQKI